MRKTLAGLLGLSFALAAAAAPAPPPLRLTGRVLPPVPADLRIELFPLVSGYAEAVRQLAGEPVAPVVTAQPRADGGFEIRAPENGLYRVRLRAEGRLPTEYFLIPLVEDTELPPVALRPATALDIVVVGPDGQPAPHLRVRALSVEAFNAGDAWRPAQSEGVTDAAGKVTLPQGGIKELSLVALAPGVPDRFIEKVEGTRHTLRLTRREPRSLEVRGKDGKPLAGVLARWNFMPYGLTGADGRLALPAVTQGATLRLENADGFLAEVPVPSEETGTIAVKLPTERSVSGRVLDAASRAPLPGAILWSSGHRPVRTDAAGRFNLRVFGGGEATVDAAAADHLASSIQARPGDDRPVTLLLQPATALAGVVTDAAGKPVAEAEVRARPEGQRRGVDSPDEATARSQADGGFRLAGVLVGATYEIVTTHQGFAPSFIHVDAAARGKSAPLRIVLRRGATLTGRAVDPAGQPIPGVELILGPVAEARGMWRAPKSDNQTVSDAAGRFRLADLSPGDFDLWVVHRGFAPRAVRGVEVPAESRTADLGDVVLAPGPSSKAG